MNIYARKPRYESSNFDLAMRTYDRKEIRRLCPDNPEKEYHEYRLPKSDYERYGFDLRMSLEEARDRAKQINQLERFRQEERHRKKRDTRMRNESKIKSAHLPPALVDDFNAKLEEDFYGEESEFLRSKNMYHWRAAQKVIAEAKVRPSDYADRKRKFYKIFIQNQWSISYVSKVINMINRWGRFQSKRYKEYFEELPFPMGIDKTKIMDAFEESNKTSKESAPIRPLDLEAAENLFKPEQYNWLYVSLWFGLRPMEVDSLTPENRGVKWDIEKTKGREVLCVYQSKLTRIERKKRWKRIPVLFFEQKKAINLILKGNLKRPIVKTVRKHLGDSYTCYGGRKGFEALLRDKGIEFEAISRYLGHLSVERTYKSYQDTTKAIIPKDF